jgi:rhodanese-related sulfurtransferase
VQRPPVRQPALRRWCRARRKGSVTVDSFEQVWKSNPGSIMLVDVRDPKEVASGMIKGSVNIPMNELEKKNAAKRQAGGLRRGTRPMTGEAARRQGPGRLPRRRRQVQCSYTMAAKK